MGVLTTSLIIPTLAGAGLPRVVAELSESDEELEVVIADNGLPARAADELSALGAKVAPMPGNIGFGAAVNRAVRFAEGDVLIVLNDDVVPKAGFVDLIVDALRNGAEMAASVLTGPTRTVECAGFELDRALTPHDYLRGLPLDEVDLGTAPPVGPCGAAAAYLRSAFLEVGGFDEAFFAYYEDVDLALRLRAAGATCALAPGAVGVHVGSSTLGYDSLRKAEVVGFSRAYFLRKWSLAHTPTAARALAFELGATALLVGRHRSLLPARARVRGWKACDARAAAAAAAPLTVGALAGARRRYARKAARSA